MEHNKAFFEKVFSTKLSFIMNLFAGIWIVWKRFIGRWLSLWDGWTRMSPVGYNLLTDSIRCAPVFGKTWAGNDCSWATLVRLLSNTCTVREPCLQYSRELLALCGDGIGCKMRRHCFSNLLALLVTLANYWYCLSKVGSYIHQVGLWKWKMNN